MKITTRGVKAHDRSLDIGKLNLFTGPNGAGKTTMSDALRFLALGYVPSLGKPLINTAALMANGSMEVELTLEDGRTVRRSMVKTGAGFQQSAEASWLHNAKSSETGKEILGLFGNEEIDVAEGLDIRQLLSATPNQRAGRIEQLLESNKRPAEEQAAAVARLVLMRLVPNLTEANMPEKYTDLLPLITQAHKSVLQENAAMLQSKIGDGGIAGAMEWANEQKRLASTGLKQKEEAAHQMRTRAAQVAEPDPRDISRLEGERDKLQQDLGAILEKGKHYADRSAARRTVEDALTAVKKTATEAAERLAEFVNGDGRVIEKLAKDSEAIVKKVTALKAPVPNDDAQFKKLQAEIDTLQGERQDIEVPEIPDTNDQLFQVKTLEKDIERAKASPWAEVLAIALELKKTKDQKTKGTRLEKLAREGLGTDIDGLEHELERARTALKEAQDISTAASKKRDAAEGKRAGLDTKIEEKVAAFKKLRAELADRHIKAATEFDVEKRRLMNERQDLEHKLAAYRRNLEKVQQDNLSAERRQTSLYDQLRGMGELPAAPPSPDALVVKLEETKASLEKLINARATHAEIQQALAIAEEAKAERDVFSAIEWALQRQREIEIAEAGGPIKKYMARFLEAAGRKEKPFFEAGQGGIGWITADDKRVQVSALSGGEFSLFTGALTAAVILCRRAEIKILLIEAGETDQTTLAQLLRGIKAVSKSLTAAIVLTPHAPADGAEGWNLVNMTSEPVAA